MVFINIQISDTKLIAAEEQILQKFETYFANKEEISLPLTLDNYDMFIVWNC